MKYLKVTTPLAVLSLLLACSPEGSRPDTAPLANLEEKLNELKKAKGFDGREEILDYRLDTIAGDEVVFTIHTTDEALSKKAVELAKAEGFPKSEILTLPIDAQLLATPYGVVSQSVANMRVGQGRSTGMATQTLMGQQMELLEVDDEGFWHRVRTAQGYIAWIPKPSFEYLTQDQADSLRALPKVMVTATTTFAYEVDNTNRVVKDLVIGNVLTLVTAGSPYTEVMIPGGRSALVKSSEVTPLEQWQQQTQFDPKHLVDFAYNFNGQ
ncbi:MAG: SH3 domain-containing protein, partial [Bacteroidota bacterium]